MSSNIAQLLTDGSKPIEQRAAEVAELLPSIGDTLHLSTNRIGAEGAKALSTALPMMTSLVTLYLGGNSIGAEGAKAICDALRDNFSLVYLSGVYSYDSTVNALMESSLERNRLIAVREERWVRRRPLLLLVEALSRSLPLTADGSPSHTISENKRWVFHIEFVIRRLASFL